MVISFAKHMNDFIFDIKPKKLKKKALDPKYKPISKPDFDCMKIWENLTPKSYLGTWKNLCL